MKPRINLKQIEAFRAVMRGGSVVAGANTLNVSQPAVSRLISQMEMRLEFLLFERKGRRLLPTAQGEQLFREVERVYVGVERIAQAAADIKHHRIGEVRIVCLPALSMWVLPRAIKRFSELHPGVFVYANSVLSRQIGELVATKEFDLGIVELPVIDSGVTILALPAFPVVLVVRRDHRLAGRDSISVKDLENERLILLSQLSPSRMALERLFYQKKISPRVAIETPHSLIACSMVREGLGVTIVSRNTAKQFVGGGLQLIEIDGAPKLEFGVILPKIAPEDPLVQSLIQCIQSEFTD